MPNPKLETYKNKATNTVYDLTDADAQSKLTAILDGTDIDSFGDVETALADKADASDLDDYVQKSATAGLLKNDGTVDTNSYLTSVPHGTADVIGGFTYDDDQFYITNMGKNTLSIIHGILQHGVSYPAMAGDVYDAIDDVYKANTKTGVHQLFKYPYHNTTRTHKGITFTDLGDGRIKISAGANDNTGNSVFYFATDNTVGAADYYNSLGKIKMSGGVSSDVWLQASKYDGTNYAYDYGEGSDDFTFNVSSGFSIALLVKQGATISEDIIISPLLTFASDTDPTHVPYAMTNRELTEKVQGIIDAATNAADFAAFKTAIGDL